MTPKYYRHGESWSAEEDRKLYDLTVSGKSVDEISDAHQRSSGSIKARQVRLGLRNPRSFQLISPFPPFQRFSKRGKPSKQPSKNNELQPERLVSSSRSEIVDQPAAPKTLEYARHGESWSAEENRKLYDLTVSGKSVDEISDAHQRSSGSIKARRKLLGLRSQSKSELNLPPPLLQPNTISGPPRLNSKDIDPHMGQSALDALIERHRDPTGRIWAAVEQDIKEIYAKKDPATSDRNAHILASRLSPGNNYYKIVTLQELGEVYKISRERVRQIENKGLRLLKVRNRRRKSWVHWVLESYRSQYEDRIVTQFYNSLIHTLVGSHVTNKFATFVITAMGRLDGLTSGKIDRLEASFREAKTENYKQERRDTKQEAKHARRQKAADKYVSTVLAKTSFPGNFVAAGVRLKEMPRLRSCKDGRELYSQTLGRFVRWESHGERRFIKALDQSSIVTEFTEQPVEIQFAHAGKMRKYYVDLLIKTVDDLTIAVEIKAPVMLADSDVQVKAKAAEEFFGRQGIGYCLVDTNGRSREDILKVRPGEELKEFLRNTMRLKQKVTMRELYDFLGGWPSQEVSDQIQCLVLEDGLNYRVRLLSDKHTGKPSDIYTFSLSLPEKR